MTVTTVALVLLFLPSAVVAAMFGVAICVVLIREVKEWLARSAANKMK
jgi:hypothetical protein